MKHCKCCLKRPFIHFYEWISVLFKDKPVKKPIKKRKIKGKIAKPKKKK